MKGDKVEEDSTAPVACAGADASACNGTDASTGACAYDSTDASSADAPVSTTALTPSAAPSTRSVAFDAEAAEPYPQLACACVPSAAGLMGARAAESRRRCLSRSPSITRRSRCS